ncbi:M48 family metallopeptidase [Zoogloea dura]|uniref:M48 family metallopeptidase n=1 Tax=Zoogloea dura TaxID=2728840 RepID=A0A848G195_9RHOO|nr:SprT family zinc-dependent metalloprotease [Zoogloea dura]NML24899.1 M48 family metallopeptidase [Zoogloea dura]
MSAPALESREIELAGQRVGYTLRRSVRKTLGLRIDHRGLTVGVPLRVGLGDIESFIRKHADWVVDQLQARPALPPAESCEPCDGAEIPVLGLPWRLRIGRGGNRIVWHEGIKLGESGPVLELALRAGSSARALLLKALQQRGLELFRNRVEEYCLRLGRPVPLVGLSSARTRWGSCSSRTGIRLHWRLIHLPLPLIDYVVAHEVAHLVEMNHSPKFWSVVESLYPDHASARRALRQAGAALPVL